MAKRIKAIQCPQCGSIQNKKIKDDYYKCDNCSTEYFIDNDDINVNVTHRVQGSGAPTINLKAVLVTIISLFLFLSLIVTILSLTKKDSTLPTVKNGFKGRIELDVPVAINDKIYVLALTAPLSSNNTAMDSYYAFFDTEAEKIVKNEKIEGISAVNGFDTYWKRFSNGQLYITINKQQVLLAGNNQMHVENITNSLFAGDSLYTSGIANVDASGSYGESLKVMNNMGREYYYYPLVKKSYPTDKMYKYASDDLGLLPGARDSIIYVFTENSSNYRKMDIADEFKLMKTVYTYNAGGAEDSYIKAKWDIDSRKDENPELKWTVKERIISYEDFTPERIYFNPIILYYDSDHLFIWVSTNAAKESPRILQRIDTKTGELMWSVPIETKNDRYHFFYRKAFCAGGKFIMQLNNFEYLVIGTDGKNEKRFDLTKINK